MIQLPAIPSVLAGHLSPTAKLLRRPTVERDLLGLPPVLTTAGPFELRLAQTERDVAKAQRLRFRCFFEGEAAPPPEASASGRRDRCPFDAAADHILVVDTAFKTRSGRQKRKVVGTYRLLTSQMASAHDGFYSDTVFDLAPLLRHQHGRKLLELGRACVDPRYRARRVIDLLWRGIGIYAAHHGAEALIGCASLPGTDVAGLEATVAFLQRHAAAPLEWQAEPRPGRSAALGNAEPVSDAAVFASMPPLIRGYLRAGARFSPVPALDFAFRCADLFTVLPLAAADRRYLAHFAAPPA